jgi:hypothetical protein
MEKLNFLTGTWVGRGVAVFPTIKRTEYIEELTFAPIEGSSVMFYELKSWGIKDGGKDIPLSFQSGYIIEMENGSIEMSNAQNNGRVEVLEGKLIDEGTTFRLFFESKMFGNDERMVKTSRDYCVTGDSMTYTMFMATKMTPEFQKHLEGELKKQS